MINFDKDFLGRDNTEIKPRVLNSEENRPNKDALDAQRIKYIIQAIDECEDEIKKMQQNDVNDANRYIAVIRNQLNLDHLKSFSGKDESESKEVTYEVYTTYDDKIIGKRLLAHSLSHGFSVEAKNSLRRESGI
jgi:hypothetical protein